MFALAFTPTQIMDRSLVTKKKVDPEVTITVKTSEALMIKASLGWRYMHYEQSLPRRAKQYEALFLKVEEQTGIEGM